MVNFLGRCFRCNCDTRSSVADILTVWITYVILVALVVMFKCLYVLNTFMCMHYWWKKCNCITFLYQFTYEVVQYKYNLFGHRTKNDCVMLGNVVKEKLNFGTYNSVRYSEASN